jgi:hypothetical protein
MGILKFVGEAHSRAKEQGRAVRARQEEERTATAATGGSAQTAWHPRGRIIALIWVGVFVLAFVAAALFQDNDPATDDAAGFGVLAGIVGGALTLVYALVGSSLARRRRE